MSLHDVADILAAGVTAAADAAVVAATTTIRGTASIPEPISPIKPTATWSHPHRTHRPHPGPGFPFPEGVHFHTIGKFGKVVAWVVFAIYALALIGFVLSALRKPIASRLLSIQLSWLAIVSLVSYYSYATGLGWAFTFSGTDARQVFFGRFLQWAVTTPLTLSILGNLAGLGTFRILALGLAGVGTEVFAGIATAVIHGIGPRGAHHHKMHPTAWGWVVFALLSMSYIILLLLIPARRSAALRSPAVSKLYLFLSLWTVLLFFPYFPVLLLGPFFGIIGPKLEFLFLSVLDVLTQVAFGGVLLVGLHRAPEAEVVLSTAWESEAGYEPLAQDEVLGVPVVV